MARNFNHNRKLTACTSQDSFACNESLPQVAQARNMSIGEHRHCCVTFKL